MIKIKINLFFLEHKIIIYFAIVLIIVMLLVKYPPNLLISDDPVMISVIGTLLGAIVGGTFSLIGSIYVNNKKIISDSEVKRKNIIYRPLYDELLDTKKIIEIENRYPSYVTYEQGYQTITRHPQITAWNRICSDSRILDTPKIVKKQYEKYLFSIEKYISIRNSANDLIQDVINKILKKEIGTECSITNLGSCVASEILDDNLKGNIIKDHCNMALKEEVKVSEEKWDEIKSEIFNSCNSIEKIKDIRKAYYDWINIQNETIKMLELLILEINIKYEKQRR